MSVPQDIQDALTDVLESIDRLIKLAKTYDEEWAQWEDEGRFISISQSTIPAEALKVIEDLTRRGSLMIRSKTYDEEGNLVGWTINTNSPKIERI